MCGQTHPIELHLGDMHPQSQPVGQTRRTSPPCTSTTRGATFTFNLSKGFAYHSAVTKEGRVVISVPEANPSMPLTVNLVELSGQVGPTVKAATNTQSNNGYVGVTPDAAID